MATAEQVFEACLKAIKKWDGKRVEALMPSLERVEDVRDDLMDEVPDFLTTLEDEIAAKQVELFIPEIWGDRYHILAVDPHGNWVGYQQNNDPCDWIVQGKFDNFENDKLAQQFRDIAFTRGRTLKEVSDSLGVSKRTLEGILQGRGFKYPTLLLAAAEKIFAAPAP